MRGRRTCEASWRHVFGVLTAGALLLLALTPMPLDHRSQAAMSSEHSHVAGHQVVSEPQQSRQHEVHPHCPLCTLSKLFLLPPAAALPLPVRRSLEAEVRPPPPPGVTPARLPQQARAPPRLG
ncbi:DUF2946 domain-containing protein [Paracoccus sp. S-4012]|uniref:DUF2946 family protein n=1 Tax=Paracoccus sp. S-4012 TaxID=2665648 RepID=UPI0012AFDFD2|nr:DUF2946 domain-containing protein [Paracoccus sp. S-4012]